MCPVLEMFTILTTMYEGKHLEQSLVRKVKLLAFMFLISSSLLLTFSSLPKAEAQTTIISLNPSTGNVGATVQLMANITNVNDTFQVMFDELNITSVNVTGNSVSASFVVPDAKVGPHNVTVTDTTTGENDSRTFTVATAYYLDVPKIDAPSQRQEGDSVPINVTITGGESNAIYVANVTVEIPYNTAKNDSYSAMLNITTSLTGNGITIANYSENFRAGAMQANTSLVGVYKVSLNSTLGVGSFTIGLTNSTEYHRDQTVDIKALYLPGEDVTLTITGKNITHPANLTADNSTGIVHYASWPVPSDAPIGTYAINITSRGSTAKNPPDIQTFSVPGYIINVTTRNLATEPVQTVNVTAFENGNPVYNQTSVSDGVAPLRLEFGNYTYEAHYKNATVSEGWLNVTSTAPWNITCNLTNLRIVVLASVNRTEIRIPEAGTFLAQAGIPQIPENLNITDINGTVVVHSLLPDINYVLNVSRYSTQFTGVDIQTLRVNGSLVDWYTCNVTCPTFKLQVNVTDASDHVASNVLVTAQENMGGIHYENKTDTQGLAIFNSILGKYQIGAYDSAGIRLNEVSVDLFQDQNISLPCTLFGLTVTIRVVDYFGQPISNANVTLQREGEMLSSTLTQGNGNAVFSGLTGGDLQVIVYVLGQTQPFTQSMYSFINSTTIEIRADKYVMLAGFFVETSQLATILIIVATVLFVVAIEVYRRGRLKPEKAET
jgi:hypothetical protein